MPQDAFSLLHTAKELNSTLSDARIDKINQPESDSVFLNVRANNQNLKLVISANAQNARVCLTKHEQPNPIVAPGFCMLLRKHLSHARIKSVELVGFERIVKIIFESKNELNENGIKIIFAEIMGKYSNIILVENDVILGAIKQSSLDEGNLRPIFSGLKYTFPISQDKVEITDKQKSFERLQSYNGGDFSDFLFNNFKGIAKSTAMEIVESYKSISDVSDNVKMFKSDDFIEYFKSFYISPKINPNVLFQQKIIDFYLCDYSSCFGEKTFFSSINEAVDEFFFQKESKRSFDNVKAKLTAIVNSYEKKLDKKIQIVLEKKLSTQNMEDNKLFGELIISNLYQIKSPTKSVFVNDYSKEDYPLVEIKLDEKISAKQNAEKYFKKYNKQKKTLQAIEPQKIELDSLKEYTKTIFEELNQAESMQDLLDVEEELVAFGIIKDKNLAKQKKKEQPSKPRKFVFEGFDILVGRNNLQNDRLTLGADRNDVFIHTKNYHSAHVIIKSKDGLVPDNVIEYACSICAYFSSARQGTKVPVDYTLKKFVKKPNGMRTGMVIYTNQKTMLVDPILPQ